MRKDIDAARQRLDLRARRRASRAAASRRRRRNSAWPSSPAASWSTRSPTRSASSASVRRSRAEDLLAIDETPAILFDQLAEDGIVTIGDEDAIPACWCPHLATLGANLAAPKYGAPFDVEVKQRHEAMLRKLTRGHETFETQRVDYF